MQCDHCERERLMFEAIKIRRAGVICRSRKPLEKRLAGLHRLLAYHGSSRARIRKRVKGQFLQTVRKAVHIASKEPSGDNSFLTRMLSECERLCGTTFLIDVLLELSDTQVDAVDYLSRMGGQAIPALVQISQRPSMSAAAARARSCLRKMQFDPALKVSALLDCLQSAEWWDGPCICVEVIELANASGLWNNPTKIRLQKAIPRVCHDTSTAFSSGRGEDQTGQTREILAALEAIESATGDWLANKPLAALRDAKDKVTTEVRDIEQGSKRVGKKSSRLERIG